MRLQVKKLAMIVANRVNSTFIFRGDTSSRGMKLFLTFSHMPNFLETCRKIEKFFFSMDVKIVYCTECCKRNQVISK